VAQSAVRQAWPRAANHRLAGAGRGVQLLAVVTDDIATPVFQPFSSSRRNGKNYSRNVGTTAETANIDVVARCRAGRCGRTLEQEPANHPGGGNFQRLAAARGGSKST